MTFPDFQHVFPKLLPEKTVQKGLLMTYYGKLHASHGQKRHISS